MQPLCAMQETLNGTESKIEIAAIGRLENTFLRISSIRVEVHRAPFTGAYDLFPPLSSPSCVSTRQQTKGTEWLRILFFTTRFIGRSRVKESSAALRGGLK